MNAEQNRSVNLLGLLALSTTMVILLMAGVSPASAQEARTPIAALPFTISQSGSYYLTKNLSTAVDQNGVTVNADNVTIDLNGFTLTGAGTGYGSGIWMKARTNVEVRNGTIQRWGGCGVMEWAAEGFAHRMVNVRVLDTSVGMALSGDSHLIKDCTVSNNGWGISVSNACSVTGNIATWNTYAGIEVLAGCLVTGNTVCYNLGKGILLDTNGNQIKGNTLRNNATRGVDVTGTDNVIEENLISGSVTGIHFGQAGNFYANNRVANCTDAWAGTATDGGGNRSF